MRRLEKIAATIKAMGVDAVLLTGQENLQYATTFPHLEGFAVITADGKGFCYTDSRYIEAATKVMEPLGFIPAAILYMLFNMFYMCEKAAWKPWLFVIVAVLVAVGAYFIFRQFIYVKLPAGILKGVLG